MPSCESGAISSATQTTKSRSFWRREPTRFGPGNITKLLGPMKWMYFHLYVIMDIFSRYVVGWMVAEQESAELAKRLS